MANLAAGLRHSRNAAAMCVVYALFAGLGGATTLLVVKAVVRDSVLRAMTITAIWLLIAALYPGVVHRGRQVARQERPSELAWFSSCAFQIGAAIPLGVDVYCAPLLASAIAVVIEPVWMIAVVGATFGVTRSAGSVLPLRVHACPTAPERFQPRWTHRADLAATAVATVLVVALPFVGHAS